MSPYVSLESMANLRFTTVLITNLSLDSGTIYREIQCTTYLPGSQHPQKRAQAQAQVGFETLPHQSLCQREQPQMRRRHTIRTRAR